MMFTDYLRCGPRWYLTELPLMMAYRTEERIGLVGVPVLCCSSIGETGTLCSTAAGAGIAGHRGICRSARDDHRERSVTLLRSVRWWIQDFRAFTGRRAAGGPWRALGAT